MALRIRWESFEVQRKPGDVCPLYGAVSHGFTADIEAQAWHIAEGRLYLFNGADPKADWVTALGSGVIATGDANWASR